MVTPETNNGLKKMAENIRKTQATALWIEREVGKKAIWKIRTEKDYHRTETSQKVETPKFSWKEERRINRKTEVNDQGERWNELHENRK